MTTSLLKAVSGEFDVESIFKLSLCRMNIRLLDCLAECPNLSELNLTGNFIEHLDGLQGCFKLKRLVLTSNKIRSLATLPPLQSVEHVYLQDNQITDLVEVNQLIKQTPNLKTLYFKNIDGTQKSPLCEHPTYRSNICRMLPKLFVLDGERVRHTDLYDVDDIRVPTELPKVALPEPEPWLKDFSWDDAFVDDSQLATKGEPTIMNLTRKIPCGRKEGLLRLLLARGL